MKVKIEAPPALRGREKQQLQDIHSYLFRLSELLNVALDSSSAETLSGENSPQSPRSLFNSMKRLIAASSELIDSYYAEIYLRLQSIFLSISDFRQFSTKTDEKFSETEKKILDSENSLTAKIDGVEGKIPQIPQIEEQSGWYILRHGDCAELWGSVTAQETELPLSFASAIAVPLGTVSGNVLSLPEEFELSAVHIIGKETA